MPVGSMKVSWWPRYPIWGGSSRIRVHSIHRALLALGHESVIGFDPSSDVCVLQKLEEQAAFDLAKTAKGIVVYDFDDPMPPDVYQRASAVADLITTDTIGHMDNAGPYVEERTPIALVPDCIDYFPTGPFEPSYGDGAVWFGYWENIPPAIPILEALHERGIRIRTVSDRPLLDYAEHVPINYETFVGELRKSHVAVLAHPPSSPKSNNKMLTAINYGLPCIVSGPAYLSLEEEMFGSVSRRVDPIRAYWRYQDVASQLSYLSRAQPYIWARFSPYAVARQWLDAISEIA